jgi:6,7-dimethyl-8-ribityllumazine synthase
MTQRQPVVEVFAGLDVSAREIKVARVPGQGQNPTLATFASHASGHKAFLAFGAVMEAKRYSEKVGLDTVVFFGASITEW